MTREEAIEMLKNTIAYESNFAEAKRMAIEALKGGDAEMNEINPKQYMQVSPNNGADLISRADAIEAVAQQWLFEASAESPYVNDDDIGEYRKLAEELFEDVPSAEQTIIGIDIPYGSDKGIATLFKGKDDRLILEYIKEIMSVVRCKDCKHNHYDGDTIFCMMLSGGHHGHTIQMVSEDFFCKYGERKEE